jgi:hypothetical protein
VKEKFVWKISFIPQLIWPLRAPLAKMQKEYFVYADADNCKCLYAGNQENYQRYQSLSVKKNIAKMKEAAPMDWSMWGPWDPGW